MDGKTPVTLLHEYLMKGGEVPDYKLVYNGVGTHDPLFQYEVSAKGMEAVGKGKSKKEAKHDAARALLLKLKDEKALEQEVEVVSPYEHSLKENAVGQLQDFCSQHSTALPRYELIRDEGLAHAKVFGIRCRVSSFITEAEARTKKQAKQQASHLMLLKLEKCLSEGDFISTSETEKQQQETNGLTQKACDETKEAYQQVVQERTNEKDKISCCRLGTSMSNFSGQFSDNVLPLSETLRTIADKDDCFFENLEDPEELLITIMTQLDYHYSYDFLQTMTETDHLCFLQIRELNCANFVGLSTSKIIAQKNASVKALQFLSYMSRL
ncbi:protein Loquacious isoform X2 [Halyomorpha halys]|nr:interferon-inducible double-stranded RNA-dependent protein kinase activator A-like isoform X2 [Halyomorpha halys]KAE8573933.1 Putative Interferon-inducible double stranded RNA-dependent protein kinase activator A [Halyomorpha halys]